MSNVGECSRLRSVNLIHDSSFIRQCDHCHWSTLKIIDENCNRNEKSLSVEISRKYPKCKIFPVFLYAVGLKYISQRLISVSHIIILHRQAHRQTSSVTPRKKLPWIPHVKEVLHNTRYLMHFSVVDCWDDSLKCLKYCLRSRKFTFLHYWPHYLRRTPYTI